MFLLVTAPFSAATRIFARLACILSPSERDFVARHACSTCHTHGVPPLVLGAGRPMGGAVAAEIWPLRPVLRAGITL